MRVITCDKCGKTVEEVKVTALKGLTLDAQLIDIDLCEECYELLDDWLGAKEEG